MNPKDLAPTRRQFLVTSATVTAAVAVGCGDDANNGNTNANTNANNSNENNNTNNAPVWSVIPDQAWVVGVPVSIDLADYCTDPDGDALAFQLDQALPPGVTLTGSVISGTPTAGFAPQAFVATADDGN